VRWAAILLRAWRRGGTVTVVDVDRSRLAAIANEGILVSDDLGSRSVEVEAKLAEDLDQAADLIIVFTKGMHTLAAAESVRSRVSDATAVLTLQNGLGNDLILADVFGAEKIVIGMTDVPADLTGPNSVSSHGQAHIVAGPYTSQGKSRADAVAAILRPAGFDVEVDDAVRVQIWEKVAFNSAMNATATVANLTVGEMDSEPGRRVIDRLWGEVADVAEASGILVDRNRIAAKVRNALDHHGGHKPSMLQDVLAGRRTEIESINGAVARFAKERGVPVPGNSVLADLVRMIELKRSL
jgi:2-dehydropantoate 2-reductase